MRPAQTGYGTGELAREFGVSLRTIRYYEQVGLLRSTRNKMGTRNFSPEEGEKLRFILEAKNVGFSIDDIKALLRSLPARENDPVSARVLLIGGEQQREALLREAAKIDREIRLLEKVLFRLRRVANSRES